MLMEAKFDSYCRKCGRPIFQGDLFEYVKESKRALCICCHLKFETEQKCPHWAIYIYSTSHTSSNRYKYYGDNKSRIGCLMCGTEFKKVSYGNTIYVQHSTTHQHGRSPYHGYSIDSEIVLGEHNQKSDPDEKSLIALQNIIEDPSIPEQTKEIAYSHIMRINKCNKMLSVNICEIASDIKNDVDMAIYKWLSNKGVYGISEAVCTFLDETFSSDHQEVEILRTISSNENIEHLSAITILSFWGEMVKIYEKDIDDDSLSKTISLLLTEFVDYKAYQFDLLNAAMNIAYILGVTTDFYISFKRYFSSITIQLKNYIRAYFENKIEANCCDNIISFSECFEKHFPLSYQVNSVIAETSECTLENWTLQLLKSYNGSYDLEDSMLGALIMHVVIENIQGWNIDMLLNQLNWSKEFECDVKYRLISGKNSTKSTTYNNGNYQKEDDESIFIFDENETGTYDYDADGYIEEGGGYNRHGYDRHGYDSDGYDEYGYSEDD